VKLVLDASAAIEVVFGRGKAASFTEALDGAEEVLAPELFIAEITNVVWKYHQFEHRSLNDCDQALDFAGRLVDTLVSCRDLQREAFLLARTTRRSAYDMFYVALARREDATFLTLDTSLKKEAQRQGIRTL
jgi:predicted nucleic acid-binding protein